MKIDDKETYFVTGFEPNATMNVAHHIIIYGCKKPGSIKLLWDCGEMANSMDTTLEKASPCSDGSQVIFFIDIYFLLTLFYTRQYMWNWTCLLGQPLIFGTYFRGSLNHKKITLKF